MVAFRMRKFAVLLSITCLMLSACSKTETTEPTQASQVVASSPVKQAASEEFKPVLYIDPKAEAGSLPYRQLRSLMVAFITDGTGSLPYRQLRRSLISAV